MIHEWVQGPWLRVEGIHSVSRCQELRTQRQCSDVYFCFKFAMALDTRAVRMWGSCGKYKNELERSCQKRVNRHESPMRFRPLFQGLRGRGEEVRRGMRRYELILVWYGA